jgi:ABC-type multidrug transport system ATPase subunit
MKAICGIHKIDEGTILVDGIDLWSNPGVLKKKIAFLSVKCIKIPSLFNVIYPLFNLNNL